MITSHNIEHVFVLMLENHSFDHMLGFSGITGTDVVTGQRRTIAAPDGRNPYNGQQYAVTSPGLNPMPVDPGHEFTDTVEQLGGPGATYPHYGPYPPIDNLGFASNYMGQTPKHPIAHNPGDPLACFAPSQVPVITALAQEFVLCDAWFSSMPGPTWPNRFFVHAGSSSGLDHSPSTWDVLKWMTDGYSFQNGTIFDRLWSQRIPWRIYEGDTWPQSFSLKNMTTYYLDDPSCFTYFDKFAADLASGYEPYYTFIEPSYGDVTGGTYTCGTSQHPCDDVARGEWLIKCTYEAIRNSPVWESSLLIVTWDEHGGFYDHVAPGAAAVPADQPNSTGNNESGFPFNLLGVRVPAVVVSPWIPANLLDPRTYDHTSVLRTLEVMLGLPPLTNRDTHARDVTNLLTLSAPRQDAPTRLPEPTPTALPNCQPITSCLQVPAEEASYARLAAGPVAPEPLDGNQPGFLHVALMRDLAVSPPSEHEARRARAGAVETQEDMRRYLLEVMDRVRAHPSSQRG